MLIIYTDFAITQHSVSNSVKPSTMLKEIVMKKMLQFVLIASFMVLCVNQMAAQWAQSNTGLGDLSVGALYAEGDTVYAGTIHGVYKSTNQGTNWFNASTGLPSLTNFYSIVRSGNYLIAGGDGAGVWRSSDFGANWVQTTSGVASNQYILAYDVQGNTVYGASGYSPAVITSTDNGATWVSSTNGLPSNQTMTGVAVLGSILFASHQVIGVHISTDGGGAWNVSNSGITAQDKNALIASGGNLIVGTTTGIFLSTDSSTSWTHVLTGDIVTGLSKFGTTIIAVGRDQYSSTNNGQSWLQLDATDLPTAPWNTMQFTSNYALVNTFGIGVYRHPLGEVVTDVHETDKQPVAFSLFQNYPNPFNPTTDFRFQILDFGFVKLAVYDVLGREVATLVNEELHPGAYQVSWNATGAPSGVYYYRLKAGSYSEMKKMVLLK